LAGYTGMKSSPYTEGALVFREKPAVGLSQEVPAPTVESVAAPPEPSPQTQSGGS